MRGLFTDLSSTIQRMYAAAGSAADSLAGVDAMRDCVGAEHVVLAQLGETRSWRACSNIGPDRYEVVEAVASSPAYADILMRSLAPDRVSLMSSLMSADQIRSSWIYQDSIKTLEGGLSAHLLWRDPEGWNALSVCRSLERGLDFDADDVARLQVLAPHIKLTEQLRRRTASMLDALAALKGALDATPLGIVALGGAGELLFANAQAERLLAARSGLMVKGRTVAGVAQRPAELLAEAVAAVLAAGAGPPKTSGAACALGRCRISLPRSESSAPLTVTVAPGAAMRAMAPGGATTGVVLLIRDPDLAEDLTELELMALYGLTRREAQLAARLVGGDALTVAAARLGVTEGTARQYLKHVFDKTGVQRQSDLVRLLLQARP